MCQHNNNAENKKSNASNTKTENEKKEEVESIKDNKKEFVTMKLYIPYYLHGIVIGKFFS